MEGTPGREETLEVEINKIMKIEVIKMLSHMVVITEK